MPVSTPSGGAWRRDVPADGATGYYVIRPLPAAGRGPVRAHRALDAHARRRRRTGASITRDNVTTLYGSDDELPHRRPGRSADRARLQLADLRELRRQGQRRRLRVQGRGRAPASTCAQAHEAQPHGRERAPRNRYLKRIRYGNRVSPPRSQPDLGATTDWLFEVVFDYGEHDADDADGPTTPATWPLPAATRSRRYRAGFEVRTYRLLPARADVPPLPGRGRASAPTAWCARPTSPTASSRGIADDARRGHPLDLVPRLGRRSRLRPRARGGGYAHAIACRRSSSTTARRSSTTEVRDARRRQPREPAGRASTAPATAGSTSTARASRASSPSRPARWFYKPNLGDGRLRAASSRVAREPVARRRSAADASSSSTSRATASSTWSRSAAPAPGFFERTADARLGAVPRRSTRCPNVDWDDPNLRFVDLDGDGHADVLITEDDVLTLVPVARRGRASAPARESRARRPTRSAARGCVFADGTQTHLPRRHVAATG